MPSRRRDISTTVPFVSATAADSYSAHYASATATSSSNAQAAPRFQPQFFSPLTPRVAAMSLQARLCPPQRQVRRLQLGDSSHDSDNTCSFFAHRPFAEEMNASVSLHQKKGYVSAARPAWCLPTCCFAVAAPPPTRPSKTVPVQLKTTTRPLLRALISCIRSSACTVPASIASCCICFVRAMFFKAMISAGLRITLRGSPSPARRGQSSSSSVSASSP
jgi:hypothetical protein